MQQPVIDDQLALRNAWVLFAAQALAGACPAIVVGAGGLAGLYLLGNDMSLATLPITALMLGNMLASIPASLYMARVGRRAGFVTGTAIGAAGALLATWAVLRGSFWAFTASLALLGVQMAFVGYMRYAAADTASPAVKPKVISRVLAGGVLAAVIGPTTTSLMHDHFAPIPFAGAFLGAAALSLAGLASVLALRTPVLPPAPMSAGRPLREIAADPRFLAAVACGTVGYALMNFAMTSAPLAMVGCGLPFRDAQLGIQWHVIAMYAPSFTTGSLIERFGSARVTAAGFVMLLGCAIVGFSGITRWHFWAALVLLGAGWNFAYIGSTAIIAGLHRQEERAKVQGANDFVVFSFVTLSSLISGQVLSIGGGGAGGWALVSTILVPLSLAALILLLFAGRREPAPA